MNDNKLKFCIIAMIIITGSVLSVFDKLDNEMFGLLMLIAGQLTKSLIDEEKK